MATQRITDRLVRDLPTPDRGKQTIVRDELLTGFGVRRTATGFTSFVFSYVSGGTDRRLTIGSPPAWSVSAAREEAKRLRRLVDTGRDPLAERRQTLSEPTLGEVWGRYATDILPRKAAHTQKNERSIWRRLILPALGQKRLCDIHGGDIDRLHNRITDRTPVQANRALASLQHLFSTAIRWRLIDFNPVSGVERNREHGRERYLGDREVERLWRALDSRQDTPSTLAIRFLLLTGARSGEAFKATWDQFDLERGVWTKPSSHTKQRRLHRAPLSGPAVEVLHRASDLRRNNYVFPGPRSGHLKSVKTVFATLCSDADLRDLRVHDLRHSFASFLVSEGTSLPIIGHLLGHTQIATTNRYSHLADEPLRSATNRLAAKVSADVTTKDP